MAPPKTKNRTVDLAAYAQPDIADLNVEHPRDRGTRSRGGYGDERGPRTGPRDEDFGDDWRVGRPAASSQTYGLEPSYSSRGGADGGRRGGDGGFRSRDGPTFERGGSTYDRPFERGPPRDRSRERRPPPAEEEEPLGDWRSGRPSAAPMAPAAPSVQAGALPSAASSMGGGKRKLNLAGVGAILSKREEAPPAAAAEKKEVEERKTVSREAETAPVVTKEEPQGAPEEAVKSETETVKKDKWKAVAKISPPAAEAVEAESEPPSVPASSQPAESAAAVPETPAAAAEVLPKKKKTFSVDALHSGKALTLTRTKAVDSTTAAATRLAGEPTAAVTSASPVAASPAPAPMRDTASMGRSIMGEDELEAERGPYSAAGIAGRSYGGFGSGERSRERRGPRYDRYTEDRYETTPIGGGAAGVSLRPERLGGLGRPAVSVVALAEHKAAARPAGPVSRPVAPVPVIEEEVEQEKKKKVTSTLKAAMRAKREALEKRKKEKAEAKAHSTKFVREDLFHTSVNDFGAIVAKIEPCFDQEEPVDESEAFRLVKAIGDISKKVWQSTAVLLALHLVVIKKIQDAATRGIETEAKPEAEQHGEAGVEFAEMLVDKYLAPAAEKATRHALPLLEALHAKQESLFEDDFPYINLQCMMRTFGTSGIARLAPSMSLAELVLLAWFKLNTPFVTKSLILEFYHDKEDETEGRSKTLTQMIQLVNWLKEEQAAGTKEGESDRDEGEDEDEEEEADEE